MAADVQRVKEAAKLMVDGDKAASKGVFKKSDWDSAGTFYERAAAMYKNARQFEAAVLAYNRASEALYNANSLYMAAKALETAGQIHEKQLGQFDRAADSYRRASGLFATQGANDRAAEMLEKAAKTLESIDVAQAIETYAAACNLYVQEDRGRFAIDTFTKTISLMVRNKRYERAVEMLNREIEVLKTFTSKSALYKADLSVVILQLELGDEVAASKSLQRFSSQHEGFAKSEECNIAYGLLDAFEQGDQDLLAQRVNHQIITFLDNEIARLARSLNLTGVSGSASLGSGIGAPPRGASSGAPTAREPYSIPGPPLPPGVKDPYSNLGPPLPPGVKGPYVNANASLPSLPTSSSMPSRMDDPRDTPPRNSSATSKPGQELSSVPRRSGSLRKYNNNAGEREPAPPVPSPRYDQHVPPPQRHSPGQSPSLETNIPPPLRGHGPMSPPVASQRSYESLPQGGKEPRGRAMSPHGVNPSRSHEQLNKQDGGPYDARATPMSPHGMNPSRSYELLNKQDGGSYDARGVPMSPPAKGYESRQDQTPYGGPLSPTGSLPRGYDPRQDQSPYGDPSLSAGAPPMGYEPMPKQEQPAYDPRGGGLASPTSATSPMTYDSRQRQDQAVYESRGPGPLSPTGRGYESTPRLDQGAYDLRKEVGPAPNTLRLQQEAAARQEQRQYESGRTASPARGAYDQQRPEQGYGYGRDGEPRVERGRDPKTPYYTSNQGYDSYNGSTASPQMAAARATSRSTPNSAPGTPTRQNFGESSPRSTSITRKYDVFQQPRPTAAAAAAAVMSPSNSTSSLSHPRQQPPQSQPAPAVSSSTPRSQSLAEAVKPQPLPNPIEEYKFERLADKVEARQARKGTPSNPLSPPKPAPREIIPLSPPLEPKAEEEDDVGYDLDDYLDNRFSRMSMNAPKVDDDKIPSLPTSPVRAIYGEERSEFNHNHEYQRSKSREEEQYSQQQQQHGLASSRAAYDEPTGYSQGYEPYEQPSSHRYEHSSSRGGYDQPPSRGREQPQAYQQQGDGGGGVRQAARYEEEEDDLC